MNTGMAATNNKRKLAFLTNMIAPYRLPLFSVLGDHFDLLVLHGGREANRESWGNPEDILSNAKVVRAWGWQIPFKQKLNGKVFNERLFHITPGFIWHLLRFRPDAVISSEMGFRSVVALAHGTIFRKPVWIGWEGTRHSEREIDPLRKVLRKIITSWANRWITCGVTATEYLLDLGVKREKIFQSQNSVDEEQFQAAVEPAWLLRPRPVVLYVGRFVELKGVRLLLDAVASLQRAGSEFSLVLVGEGREKQALEQRAVALGLKNVHFQPAQPPEKMPSVYRSADLVVFPTLQDVWGFVANEAVLCGVPVLCSKYAGCAAELFPAENIFSPDDPSEFAEKLEAAIAGRLPKPDPTRLKTTEYLGRELVNELNRFIRRGSSNQQPAPEAIVDIPRDPIVNTGILKPKLALLTNMIAPYRVPLFSVLGDHFDLLVLHGGKEANRESWGNGEDILSNAKAVRAWGWQIRFKQKLNGKVFNERLFHITPGFIWQLLRFRPDAVISSEMGFRSAVALGYGTIFRKPVWIWWAGTRHSERKIDPFRRVIRRIFRLLADRWITYGQSATEYLWSLGVKGDRILQSQNAVDEKQFTGNAEPAWVIWPRPVVLHVGRLIELKGIGSLFDAAAILQRKGYEFSLLLVGDGREKQTLEHRALALGLNNVHFRPAQPQEKMLSVYRSADLVVFPTLQDVWGVVANEAILAGVPMLCSKYAGCATELFPPENIFSPDDLNDFCQKLGAAICNGLPMPDPSRLKTTNQLGREIVQELNNFMLGPTSGKRGRPQPVT